MANRSIHPEHTASRGFSLIEVLVVIGIIGVLLSVLLPTLSAARETARQSVCSSNLRQLVLASHAYADDSRGLMPPGAADILRNLSRWHGTRSNPSERFRPVGGPMTEYLGDESSDSDASVLTTVRRCPSFSTVLQGVAGASGGGGGFEVACGGYGYNNVFVGVQRSRSGRVVTDRAGSPLTGFAMAARTITFADAAFASDSGIDGVIEYSFVEPRFWPDSPGSRADPSVHFRHRGTAGIAWMDAHISREAMTFSWSSGIYGVDAASVGVGFIGATDDNSLYGE